jgi:hypothetical protein
MEREALRRLVLEEVAESGDPDEAARASAALERDRAEEESLRLARERRGH